MFNFNSIYLKKGNKNVKPEELIERISKSNKTFVFAQNLEK